MKKVLSILSLISVMACSGQAAMQPTAPPAIAPTEIKVDKVAEVSPTMVEHKGDTWSVAFPESFKVVESETNDQQVYAKMFDDSALMFVKEASTDTTESISSGLIVSFMIKKGIKPAFVADGKVAQFDAKEIVYNMGGNKAAVLVIFATGTNAYSVMYGGSANKDRQTMFKAVVDSVKVNDVPVVDGPQLPSTQPRIHSPKTPKSK